MEKILSYKNVSFRRDGREILKNINWGYTYDNRFEKNTFISKLR